MIFRAHLSIRATLSPTLPPRTAVGPSPLLKRPRLNASQAGVDSVITLHPRRPPVNTTSLPIVVSTFTEVADMAHRLEMGGTHLPQQLYTWGRVRQTATPHPPHPITTTYLPLAHT
jgi:hypothetical protein